MITPDYVKELVEIGKALNKSAMRHNLDSLRIQIEPELEYVYVRGYRAGKLVMSAQHFGLLDKDDIKIAPQGAKEMEILVRFNGSLDRIPMYVTKIVEAAAEVTNVSFTEMIQHTETCHDLMLEVSSNRETITKMEDKK